MKSQNKAMGKTPPLRVIDGRTDAGDDPITEINKEFAIVKASGILCQTGGEDKIISTSKFKDWLANRDVSANEWLRSPDRREYNRIVFRPGEATPGDYNLWKGFAVEPLKRGTCDRFLYHVREHVCHGNDEYYAWAMSFFAEIVQRPMDKSGVSIVIRGHSGGGKTIVGQVMGSLFPRHYMLVDQPEQVTGKFNAHMASLLLLQADEAFFAGDPRNGGKLRSLVTRHEHVIEPKGVDTYRVPNYMRLFITSEEDWVVPASLEERRFAIFDISDDVVGDEGFFRKMFDELDNGGYERLLYELQRFDMVNLHELPQTQGLRENKVRSLRPDMKWWVRCLERGTIVGGGWREALSREDVFAAFVHDVGGPGDKSTQTSVGMFLRKVVPGLVARRGEYVLPTLSQCRQHFEQKYKVKLSQ